MKHTLICILGSSGSGKTLAARYIEETLSIPTIVSMTTRPMREGEVDGVDHWFVDASELPYPEDIIAYSYFNGHHYWAERCQIKYNENILHSSVTTYVIDEVGLLTLKPNDKYNIKSIYIHRDEDKRIAEAGEQRVARDASRIALPDSYYDAILANNGNLEEFHKAILTTIKSLL